MTEYKANLIKFNKLKYKENPLNIIVKFEHLSGYKICSSDFLLCLYYHPTKTNLKIILKNAVFLRKSAKI